MIGYHANEDKEDIPEKVRRVVDGLGVPVDGYDVIYKTLGLDDKFIGAVHPSGKK
jgi:hypothetical protein